MPDPLSERGSFLTEPRLRRVVPAWFLSLGLHLLVMLLAGWLVGREPIESAPRPSDDRRAAIVLVRRDASAPPEYFDEPDDAQFLASAASLAAADSASRHTATAANFADPLSGVNSAAPQGSIQLPDAGPAPNPAAPSELVATPGDLGGRGRTFVLPGIDAAAILAEDAARPRAAAPVGTPAKLSLFGAPSVGRSFVFVIDRSESMGGSGLGAIQAAAAELERSIAVLSADQRFQVVAYNRSAALLSRTSLLTATDENKADLIRYVREISAFGATEHSRGLIAALRFKPEVIYLLTDGGDPVLDNLQLRTIREQAAGQTSIHCIQFGAGPRSSGEFLERLADENRGTFVYIDVNAR